MKRGHLFIISGPAGAGKGTLRKMLFDEITGLAYSVSCTTRKKRAGETEGRDYYYVSREEFDEMVSGGEFLEWAEVHGNRYGTRKSDVARALDAGRDLVFEIDVEGCRSLKEIMPDAVTVFITVLSLDELEIRLEERGSETAEQMNVRLRNAALEMKQAALYDHVIVNDDMKRASRELADIINSYRNTGR